MEIRHDAFSRRMRIAPVVVPEPIVECQSLGRTPGVLNESSAGQNGKRIVAVFRCPRDRIIGKTAFRVRLILDERNKIVELKRGLPPSCGKVCNIISVPAFISQLDGMRSLAMAKHIAPVMIGLHEVSICEAATKSKRKSGDVHDRNSK